MAKKKPAKSNSKSFQARLEPEGSRLKWTVIHVPFNVAEVWGSRGMVKVAVELNGHGPFRTSLFPAKSGRHFVMINKKMKAAAKIAPGSIAKVRLELDTAPRTVTLCLDLARLINQDKALRRFFEALGYSARREINDWVAEPKNAETRERRAYRLAERLLETMEAERELPPLIRAAF